ncbi:MAG: hypothetical protein IT578_02520 [Verrucomicrobiae bacterium]|nr:hypothetical protein [Verrucomicrobiae bacterium]
MPLLKIDEKKKPIVTLIAILAIVISLISIFVTQCERPPKVNLKPYLGVSEVLADETAKLLGPSGGSIVVISLDTKASKIPTIEAQLNAFHAAIKKKGNITIAATETLSPDKMGEMGPEMGLPSKLFHKALSQHGNANVFVSFLGAPVLKDEEIAQLPPTMPKLIVFASFGMGLKKLFDEQVIQTAIVPNIEPNPNAKKNPVTSREWFDQYYMVVTKETADKLSNY